MNALASLAAILILAVAPVAADDVRPETPTSVKGARVVTVEEAKNLLERKATNFVDARSPLNFGKGHVPGATMASYKEKSEFKVDFDATQDHFDLAKLPAEKNASVVIYSDGPSGWKAYKATVVSVKAGYRNVLWMRDGFAGWVGKALPVEH